MKILLTMIAGMALLFSQASAQSMLAKSTHKSTSTTAKTVVPQNNVVRRSIAADVFQFQSKRGWPYAYKIADMYVASAHKVGVHPFAVAAIGAVESKHTMSVGKYGGIMQFIPSTFNKLYGKRGLKVTRAKDNIQAGSHYFATHIPRGARTQWLTSRSGNITSRNARGRNVLGQYQAAWRRYNGGGDPRYVSKTTRAYLRMTSRM